MAESAPILSFAMAPAPPGGFGVAHFRELVARMDAQLDELTGRRDRLAVFHLTYLTFSKRVLAALEAGRFEDPAWAGDMCCRFVAIYLAQIDLWYARDPRICRTWGLALARLEGDAPNVMQAMLLGMNAHIHYDLAFCTLGACVQAGDVPWVLASGGFHGARGVPTSRYRDFLLINRVGWESIPIIQDTVLRRFAPLLWIGNLALRPWTSDWGQRVLLESRDAAWAKTVLLLHCTSAEERDTIAAFVDQAAERWAELIGALTVNPVAFSEALAAWEARGTRLDPATLAGLLDMIARRVPTADLLADQLVAMGVDAVRVGCILHAAGATREAARFVAKTLRSPRSPVRAGLSAWLLDGGREASALASAMLELGFGPEPSMPPAVRAHLRAGAARAAQRAGRHLADPRVRAHASLAGALVAEAAQMDRLAGAARRTDRAAEVAVAASPDAHPDPRELLAHPDRWIRLCARVALAPQAPETELMAALIERTLFLKDSPLFAEVEAADLLALAEELEDREHAAGATILGEGDLPSGLHLVVEGEVRVAQARGAVAVEVARLARGDALGELSILTNAPTSAACVAGTVVKTLFVPQEVFTRLLQEQPRLSIGLLRVLGERLAATTRRVG
jgi:hypothetical protein